MRSQDALNNISTDYWDTITLNDSVPVQVESFIDSNFWDASPTS